MKRKSVVFSMAICSVMAALSIVLYYLNIDFGFAKLTFYALPIMFVSIIYGKGRGLITGLIVATITQLFSSYGIGITSIVWGLAAISWGAFSEVFNVLFKKMPRIIRIILVVLFTSLIAFSCNTIATYADYLVYGGVLNFNLITRLLALPITIPVYVGLLYAIDIRKEVFNKKSTIIDEN